MELGKALTQILDHACPNGGITTGWTGEEWSSFYIETHCVAWKITARKNDNGWEIRDIQGEDC